MIYKFFLQLPFFLFSLHFLYSQKTYSTFVEAKKMFFRGNYSNAITGFDSLVQKENEFKIYSIYYSALCDYYLENFDQAIEKLNKIDTYYNNWPQIDESNYWLIKLLIKKKDYDLAFQKISTIRSEKIKKELYIFLDPIIKKIDDFNMLKKWYENFPDNLSLSKYYGRKLLDEYLNEKIINQINEILKVIPKEDLFISSDEYTFNIALLLPFMYHKSNSSSFLRNNRFVFDFYKGVRLAKDHLDSLKVRIKIHPFDTKRDPNVVKSILTSQDFDKMDLIVGPLYSSPVKIVKQYCLENKKIMINPLSSNDEIIQDNNYVILFLPSYKTIALKAAEYASEYYDKNKNGIIFYQDTKADSLIASIYEKEMKSYGFNFIYTQKVLVEESRLILDSLTNSYEVLLSDEEADSISEISGRIVKEGRGIDVLDTTYRYEEKFYLGYDSVGHIFTVSTNSLLSSNTLSGVDVRQDTISVLGFGEWLNYDVITLDQLERLDVSLINPRYINYNSNIFKILNKNIINSFNELPTENLIIGFEIINMIGKIVEKYGKYFQFGLRNENLISGDIFESFQYLF